MVKRAFNFNSIPAKKLKRSAFNLSHEHKLSCNMGTIVPFLCTEMIPGDTFKISPTGIMRTAALISPMMHRVDVYTHFFKVPLRLIWQDYETFFTGGPSGEETVSPPYVTMKAIADEDEDFLKTGSLADYLGLPLPYKLNASTGAWEYVGVTESNQKISTLPMRAYMKVYNDYFIDRNVMTEVEVPTTSGSDADNIVDLMMLRRRCWVKDYFTSALPTPQRGPEVKIPITGNADVNLSDGSYINFGYTQSSGPEDQDAAQGEIILNTNWDPTHGTGEGYWHDSSGMPLTENIAPINYIEGLYADLENVNPIGIIALRYAFKLQQFLERDNVGGSRYIEHVLSHFGVRSSDSRVDRAEYLGGGKMPVVISEVEQTSESSNTPQGNLAGKGKSTGSMSKTIKTFAEEHCILIGVLSVMPKPGYSQGLSKMWTRFEKFDYFYPEFENIGEQEVKSSELYYDPEDDDDSYNNKTFGYQARYSDLKYLPDRISGDFRTSLSFWHLSRLFSSGPGLNKKFLECDPSDRVFAVSDEVSDQHLLFDIWIDFKALRPMSVYSTPKMY